jgi:quercetin dioxygenase-like cupin family protein
MTTPYQYFANLASELPEIPVDSIVSRTLHNTRNLKVILFGFAAGQELSEHTAARPAILHFLRGEALLTLGGDPQTASAGSLVYLPPRLLHSLLAKTEVIMLLLMLATDESA